MKVVTKEKKGFKRTEVGVIPEDWNLKTIEDLTSRIGDGIHATPKYDDSGKYYFINGNNLSNGKIYINADTKRVSEEEYKTHKRSLNKGTILLSINGTIGNVAFYNDEKVLLGKSAAYLNTINSNTKELLYYQLQTKLVQEYFYNNLTGTTIKNLGLGTIRSTPIPLPPTLEEQQAIADALSDVDELIRSLDALIQKKEAIKKGTMQQLLTGNKRLPGFDGEWEVKNLGDVLIASPDYGINAPAVDYNSNYPTYLRITDISGEGNFVHSGKKSVKAVNSDLYYLSEGEIVLARTGASTGKSYHYKPKDGELVFAGFLIRIKPDPKKAESKFLKYYLQTDQYWNWVEKNSMRSGQPGLNSVQYSSLKISFPNLEEQKAIAQILSDMDEELQALRRKREKMVGVKEGMMQELLTGKTRLV